MPIRQSLCGSLRRDGHWKCFCLTFLILICLSAISWCKISINASKSVSPYVGSPFSNTDQVVPCKEGYIYIPVAFVIMLYLVYLVECWHSHIRLELRYKVDMPTVYSTLSEMQAATPVIWWKATCYHYVRRTRRVMRYRNGDAFSSTQVYYERVDSNTAGAAFNFTNSGVKDISRPIHNLEKFQAIKIKVSKGFSFANVETEYEFEEQRSQFFQDYETRDDYMEGREGMDLMNVDFKEYMIAFSDPNQLPWYVSHSAFWIASSLLLSWPLRTIIEYKTAHLHYHIHKLFGSNYVDAENYPNLMTRVNTMNSDDLEMSIRNNNVIVPSYSEAMLNNAFEMQTIRDYGATKSTHKFPRSLTNVNLAARSSTNVISNVPAITMNRVKRFNSCSAFEDQSLTEVLSTPGTIRNQISQLFRDRNSLRNKRNARSSVSVAGFPFTSRPSDRTPDGIESIRSSLSTYSVASRRHHVTSSSDASANVRNSCHSLRRILDHRQSIPEIAGEINSLQDSQFAPIRTLASRLSNGSSPNTPHQDSNVSVDINSPSSLSYQVVRNDSSTPYQPLPTPANTSPPQYEEALRTCQVADQSSRSTSHRSGQSIEVIQDNTTIDIQSSSANPIQTPRERIPYNHKAAAKRPTSIESTTSDAVRVNNRNVVTTQPGLTVSEQSSLPSIGIHHGCQFSLKSLPKVSVPTQCTDQEDSDIDCTRDSPVSEAEESAGILPIEQTGTESSWSMATSGPEFHAPGSCSDTQNSSRVTLVHEHSTIGLSHGRTGNGREIERPCSPIGMETSV